MFTGLVADLGRVAAIERSADGVRLTISSHLVTDLHEGDSVAVNGVCLTATALDGDYVRRLRDERHSRVPRWATSTPAARSTSSCRSRDRPARRSRRPGRTSMDGHGSVRRRRRFARRVRIEVPRGLLRYVVEKGSISSRRGVFDSGGD